MRLFKLICVFALAGLACSTGHAQNELDAYRYSGGGLLGTARSIGMGGAFSAVGADYSAATLNPAGLAVYRRSELMFTPTLRTAKNTATYLDQVNETSRGNFGFSNIGYVHSSPFVKRKRSGQGNERSGLKSYSFGIGFNQLNNFSRRTRFDTYNPENSITDYWAGLASGVSINDVFGQTDLVGMAANAGMIDTSGVDGNWVGAALGGQMQQALDLEEWGRNNEWDFSFAGNINDKIYAGITLGIQDLRYNSELSYTEEDVNMVHQTWNGDSTPVNRTEFTELYGTRGSGVNVRLGVIARPVDFLRIGVSFQSPTWLSMTDEYQSEVTSYFDNDNQPYGIDAQTGFFTYNLTTPYKLTVGAMALIKKFGFISADFEYMDYTSAKFSSDASPSSQFYYNFLQENQNIRTFFDATYNIRLGGEVRFGPGRFRLGYANFGAVLNEEYLQYLDYESRETQSLDGNKHLMTTGIGYKQNNYYIDFAYARELSADRRLLYTVQDPTAYSPELINNVKTNIFSMTIGFTF